MALETATYIGQLVPTNPTGTDPKSQGDDQIRLIKQVLQNTFPNTNTVYTGGQMYGTATVKSIFYNAQTIAENLTVATGQNGMSAGPVTVDNGFSVTVNAGSTWTVV